MNPYASHLGNQNALEVIASTPDQLAELLSATGAEKADVAPAAGKWSVREILCHLADTELVFSFRLRQALSETYHVIQPIDQDRWATRYNGITADAALAVFTAVRKWNLALLKTVAPEEYSKRLTHPERGEMTFQVLVETMGGHDLNHVRQIKEIASRV